MADRPRPVPQVNGGQAPAEDGSADRLESWKEIAEHLNRTVRTVQRWEKVEGLPVHRHQHDERSSVYGFRTEIGAWWRRRRVRLGLEEARLELAEEQQAGAPARPQSAAGARLRWFLWPAAALGMASIVALLVLKPWRSAHFQSRYDAVEIVKLTDSGRVEDVAISPDGQYVAYEEDEPGGVALRLRQIATESDVQILAPEAVRFDGLTFSPDGKEVYVVRGDARDPGFKYLYAMPRLGGPSRRILSDIDAPVSFSPDGRQFVYTRAIPARNETEVRIADADGGGNRLLANMTATYAFFQIGATWSPDGRTVAVSVRRFRKQPVYALYSIGVTDGAVSEIFASSLPIGRPSWLPDGKGLLLELRGAQGEGKGQLWTVSYPEGKAQRLTNDLTDFDLRADLTRDGSTLAGVNGTFILNLWAASGSQFSDARQITSLNLQLMNAIETTNGKLLAVSYGRLLSIAEDGKKAEPFGDLGSVGTPAVCGQFVVVNSYRNSAAEMMRVDEDGSNPVKLVSGNVGGPACARGGANVFYIEIGPPQKIFRIPIQGGKPVEVARIMGDTTAGRISVSPDGTAIAYPYEERGTRKLKFAIVRSRGGPALKTMDAPAGAFATLTQWSADGRSIQYALNKDGAANVWEQPLDGSPARQLTRFTSSEIHGLSWSADRKRLLLARGEANYDVVLLKNLR